MNILYKITLGFCLASLLTSCYEDKGKYDIIDYNKINKISLKGSTPMNLGDMLEIKATIDWRYPDQDTLNFDYEWRINDVLISTERDLSYKIPDVGMSPVYLHVTERKTNITSRSYIQINVNTPYLSGWLLLAEKNGKSDLSYIRRDSYVDDEKVTHYEYNFFPSIYEELNSGLSLGQKPVKLVTNIFPTNEYDEILVLQKNNESVFIDGTYFLKGQDFKNEFSGGQIPGNLQPIDYRFHKSTAHVLLENGDIYWKKYQINSGVIHSGTFLSTPVLYDKGGVKIKKFIDNNYYDFSAVSFYDTKNNRWLNLYAGTSVDNWANFKMPLLFIAPKPADYVDLEGQSGYDHVYSTEHSKGSNFMHIFKNVTSGDYVMQDLTTINVVSAIMIFDIKQNVIPIKNFVNDESVYLKMKQKSYIFMSNGSKLYFYDLNTKLVKLYHDFGNGKIVDIVSDANGGEVGIATENGDFYICAVNDVILGKGNPGTEGGILYEKHDLGKLVDVEWKWGNWNNYIFGRYL